MTNAFQMGLNHQLDVFVDRRHPAPVENPCIFAGLHDISTGQPDMVFAICLPARDAVVEKDR